MTVAKIDVEKFSLPAFHALILHPCVVNRPCKGMCIKVHSLTFRTMPYKAL